MGPDAEHSYWLIEPLIAAGMDLDEIRALVTRLACGAPSVEGLVDGRPAEVRAAWTETIGRMLSLHP